MDPKLSRRDFIKIGSLAFSGLAFQPLHRLLPPVHPPGPIGIGRVTVSSMKIYKYPSYKGQIVEEVQRDHLIPLLSEVISPEGPEFNPRWYRIINGYAHSAYLQRVEDAHLNTPVRQISKEGKLGEVTVPFTQSMMLTKNNWEPLYRLYFRSVHWITGVDVGPDGQPWYRLKDELLRLDYHVPGAHVRLIPDEDLAPISPEVPPEKKRIEVSLASQIFTAFEGDKIVLHTKISSGLPPYGQVTGESSETPRGIFNVDPKVPSKHMGNGQLTSDPEAYELPGVPWVSFFVHDKGVAFHGTYWHDNFGGRMSHGCVNMRVEDAKWLYRWSHPTAKPSDWTKMGYGTRVVVE